MSRVYRDSDLYGRVAVSKDASVLVRARFTDFHTQAEIADRRGSSGLLQLTPFALPGAQDQSLNQPALSDDGRSVAVREWVANHPVVQRVVYVPGSDAA